MNDSTSRIMHMARHEYRAATRSRVLIALLAILIVSTTVSVLIGTTNYAAQLAEYDAYLAAAQARGLDRIAPSPLAMLSLLRGAYEYLEVIGAVLAITLGYLSVSRERANLTLSLLRSRPLTGAELATGNFLGALAIFSTMVAASALVGVVSLGIFGHDWINPAQALRLLLASIAALIYLSAFYCLGAIATAKAKVSANGLTVALGVWLVIVLVLPQIGDTLDADNQIPGGLFAAVGLNHDGELAVLTHFQGYERVRTGLEEASLAKHFERFAFAMTDVKERYRPFGLPWLLNETRRDIVWLLAYGTAMFLWLRRTMTRMRTITQGEKS